VGLGGLTGTAFAQDPVTGQTERAERQIERSDTFTDTGITYADVLRDPDNVRLNLEYARSQVARGQLKGASATLERVLLIAPESAEVHFFLGLVYFRLGQYSNARTEIEQAIELGLSPEMEEKARSYTDRIGDQLETTRFSLTLTIGVQYDDNMNQSPTDGTALFIDFPIDVDEENKDFALLGIVKGRVEHDFGNQDQSSVYAEATYFESDKIEVDRLDLRAAGLEFGATFNQGKWSLTPFATGNVAWLQNDEYLNSAGLGLRAVYRLSPTVKVSAEARGIYEDFMSVPASQSAPLRDGQRYRASGRVDWAYSPTMRVGGEVYVGQKNASVEFESFSRFGVRANHTWLLGRGQFLLTGASAEMTDYDGPDFFVSPTTVREDEVYRANIAYGVPLATIAAALASDDWLPSYIGSINLIAQYEYEKSSSNLSNYDYEANRAQLLMSKRFQ